MNDLDHRWNRHESEEREFEELPENDPENYGGDARNQEYVRPLPHAAGGPLPDEKHEQRQYQPMPHVSEHHAKEHREHEGDYGRGVHFVSPRNPLFHCYGLEDSRPLPVYHQGRDVRVLVPSVHVLGLDYPLAELLSHLSLSVRGNVSRYHGHPLHPSRHPSLVEGPTCHF